MMMAMVMVMMSLAGVQEARAGEARGLARPSVTQNNDMPARREETS